MKQSINQKVELRSCQEKRLKGKRKREIKKKETGEGKRKREGKIKGKEKKTIERKIEKDKQRNKERHGKGFVPKSFIHSERVSLTIFDSKDYNSLAIPPPPP